MKMKKLLVCLLAFGLSAQEAPAQSGSHFSSGSATRKLSDDGDTNRYVSTPQDSTDMSMVAPTVYTQPSVSGDYYQYDGGSYYDNGGSYSQSPNTWLTAETLLVFAADRKSPVLATTAALNVFPLQGNAGVNDRFGGTLNSDLLPGYRLSAGKYFGTQQKVGFGARGYGIYDGSESFAVGPGGGVSIGVPFFNLARGSLVDPVVPGQVGFGNDAYVVQGNTPPTTPVIGEVPISEGTLRAQETLKMMGGELSGYVLLARSGSFRNDLVAGYTYNQLRNRVTLDTTSTNLFTGDLILNGTVLTTHDEFSADNRFNGAHVGVLSSVVRNRVSLSTLAKVSFGNMRSRVGINGNRTIAGVPGAGGIFTQASNIGATYSDRFAFLPEVGFKLGYSIRPRVQLTVGYTLLVWSDVVLAGEQIDNVINLTGLGTRPAPLDKHSAYWMQSVDLGMNLIF